MRVLLLNYEYPPLGGGAANATYFLLQELGKRKGLQIDLVTSSANGRYEKECISNSITIYKLPVQKKSIHYWTLKEILSYSIQARSFIKKLRPEDCDLIHAFFGIPCGMLAHRYRKKTPYIVSLRGSDVPGFNERFFLQYIILKPLIRKIWRDAAAVIANSIGLKDLACQTDPITYIDIIPNGIDVQTFPVHQTCENSTFTILTVARLIRRKGVGDLIQAVPEILRDYPNLKVRIIGEGNLETELRNLAEKLGVKDTVEFMGYVPHEELPRFYSTSDLFVLPSHYEGMSNTILEAMAAGLPIVTTDTGGTSELIRDNGKVIPPGRPDVIAKAVKKYLDNPSIREEHGKTSRTLAESMGWDKIAEQYLELYQRIAQSACSES